MKQTMPRDRFRGIVSVPQVHQTNQERTLKELELYYGAKAQNTLML